MTGLEIALVIGFAALGAMVQGCLGIGIGLVAAPVLVSIDPAFAPGPLLLIGQVVGLRHVFAEREHIDRAAFRNVLFGIPAGMAAGLTILLMIDGRVLSIIVGAATALAAAAILLGARVARSQRVEITAGGLMAFASVTAALPGPPLVIGFSDMKPSCMRGTASASILVVAILAGISLLLAGRFGTEELKLLGLLLPGALLGLLSARYLRPVLDRSWFRTAVLVMACAGGIALVIRQAMG